MRRKTVTKITSCVMLATLTGRSMAQEEPAQRVAADGETKVRAGEKGDPFRVPEMKTKANDLRAPFKKAGDGHPHSQLDLTYYVFSLPLAEAAAMQRKGLSDTEHFNMLVAGVERGDYKQEKFIISKAAPAQSTFNLSATEHIYATVWQPPTAPSAIAGLQSKPKRRSADTQPTAREFKSINKGLSTPNSLDTKIVGDNIVFEYTIAPGGEVAEISFQSEHVTKISEDTYGKGVSATPWPRYGLQRLKTGQIISIGEMNYLGTLSPLTPEGDPAEKVIWQAFITLK